MELYEFRKEEKGRKKERKKRKKENERHLCFTLPTWLNKADSIKEKKRKERKKERKKERETFVFKTVCWFNLLVTVPSRPSLSCSIVFFSFPVNAGYLSFFSLSFSFTLGSAGTAKSTIRQVPFFVDYLLAWSSVRDWMIHLYLKSLRILRVSFSRTNPGLSIYCLFVWSNLNFWHNSQ